MLGIFAPPATKIRKKLSAGLYNNYDFVLVTVKSLQELDRFPYRERELVLGLLMSSWVCNSCAAGEFGLDTKTINYIQNIGINCLNLVGHYSNQALDIVEDLIDKGVIPKVQS